MTSTAAGLKEFGDGDAALFNGNILLDLNSQEDFETEFHRLLTEGGPFVIPAASDDQEFLHYSGEFRMDANATSVNSLTDFFASPPDTMKHEGPGDPVKFVEDPLSTHLNSAKKTSKTSSDSKTKRGRPPLLRFTAVEYEKTTINTKKPRKTQNLQSNQYIQSAELKYRHRRSENDCYSPSWIRGRGCEREGLCPLCEPPVWFKIKQSAYWYHLNFYHGISASSGKPYNHPISYRFAKNENDSSRVEGHCGNCLQWIFLSSDFDGEQSTESVEDKMSFTTWYKHAQKCHYRSRDFQIPEEF